MKYRGDCQALLSPYGWFKLWILTTIHVKKSGISGGASWERNRVNKSTPLELNSTFDDSFFFSFLYLPNIRETSYR